MVHDVLYEIGDENCQLFNSLSVKGMVGNRIGSVSFPTPARGGGAGAVEEARPVGLHLKDEGGYLL